MTKLKTCPRCNSPAYDPEWSDASSINAVLYQDVFIECDNPKCHFSVTITLAFEEMENDLLGKKYEKVLVNTWNQVPRE